MPVGTMVAGENSVAEIVERVRLLALKGDRDAALSSIEEAFAIDPDNAVLLKLRGTLRADIGDTVNAVDDLAAAVMKTPTDYELLAILATQLHRLKLFDQATVYYVQAIRNAPESEIPRLYCGLGLLMSDNGNHRAAVELFDSALTADPTLVAAALNLTNAHFALREYDKGAALCRRMLAVTETSELYHNLGNSLHMIPGREVEAVAAYAKAVELDPGNANARHMLAVLSGGKVDAIPADYVAGLFDGYASFYDTDLIGKLQYRVPGLIRKALVKVKPGRAHFPALLDIGCGTGLTGLMVRDLADEMTGIDLSPNMVAQALEKKIYNRVQILNVEETLGSDDRQYDAAVAGDVLGYIGAVDKLIDLVFGRLVPGGLFVFSAEVTPFGTFVMQKTGRFAHSASYLTRTLSGKGFRVISAQEFVLRRNGPQNVRGLIISAQRPQ